MNGISDTAISPSTASAPTLVHSAVPAARCAARNAIVGFRQVAKQELIASATNSREASSKEWP